MSGKGLRRNRQQVSSSLTKGGRQGKASWFKSAKTWIALFGVIWVIYAVGVVVTVVKVHQMGDTAVSSDHIMGGVKSRMMTPDDARVASQALDVSPQKHQRMHQQQQQHHQGLSPDSTAKVEIQKHVNHRMTNGAVAGDDQAKDKISDEAIELARKRDEKLAELAEQQRKANLKRVRRPRFKANPYGHMVEPNMIAPHSLDRPREQPPNKKRDQVLKIHMEPIDKSIWKERPLPVRTTTAADLTQRAFPQLNSCRFLPSQWPVDEYPDDDPYLPWIHDVFPSHEGDFIQFVAQNKRRCQTGTTPEEEVALDHWEPQITQFQHVPLKRTNTTFTKTPRYRLSSHEEADHDAMATRFICRFKDADGVVLEETLSVFNNDYEWTTYRKHLRSMFSPDGRNLNSPHTSQLIFKCPVPQHLQEQIRTGDSVVDDWATLFIDLVTIRTPPRYGPPTEFLVPNYDLSLPSMMRAKPPMRFDANVQWGDDHILPTVEDSGRWENVPICRPSMMEYEPDVYDQLQQAEQEGTVAEQEKTHNLVSCLWASAGYTTRGNRFAINDGQRRMLEWLTHNQNLGFDHFYIYDNSGAFSKTSSLQPIADLFPGKVTVIPWPSRVCNNNPNNVDSPGERSSQYAAESSCSLRFGPHVKWIGQFDIDEYLIPMGEYDSVLPLLDKLEDEGKKIISFDSWRAWPRRTHINTPVTIKDKALCESTDGCFDLVIPNNVTVLAAYNCDRQKPGKKLHKMPAEKQIYRADYVRQHFVHYSTITASTMLNYTVYGNKFGSAVTFPDPLSRFGDEVNEGLMVHSKAVARQDTAGWLRHCNVKGGGDGFCRIGFPWPDGAEERGETKDADGWKYNCYLNPKIDDFWVPKLEKAMAKYSHLLQGK